MRYYRLLIDGKEFSRLDASNPQAIRITFDLKQYGDTMFPYGLIDIYNVSAEWFNKFNSLIGKRIELYASIIEDPLTKKQGMKIYQNNLICFGYIQNLVFNPNLGTGNKVTFVITSSNEKSKGILLEIKEGDNIKEIVKSVLQNIYKGVVINTTGVAILANFKEQVLIKDFLDATRFLKRYDLDIKRTINGFEISDIDSKVSIKNITSLNPQDFLEQPTKIREGVYSMSLNLRGDLKLNSIVTIPQRLFVTLSSDLSLNFSQNKTYIAGNFNIVKIWHIGDSRNVSPQSWATNLEVVKYDN